MTLEMYLIIIELTLDLNMEKCIVMEMYHGCKQHL